MESVGLINVVVETFVSSCHAGEVGSPSHVEYLLECSSFNRIKVLKACEQPKDSRMTLGVLPSSVNY